jgi:Bacterial TSP3 repeat
MRHKLGLAVIVLLAATLALVGALREVNTTRAGAPLPVKPVLPGVLFGAYKSTALGVPGYSQSDATNTHGRRSAFSTNWGHGSRGNPDISIDNNDPLGFFQSYSDVLCNATDDLLGDGTDLFAQNLPGKDPWPFKEEDTDLIGNGMEWLIPQTNGFGLTARFETLMDGVWLNASTWIGLATIPVNILTMATPWAPHTGPSGIFVSGAPALPTITCTQDAGGSWAHNLSETNGNLTSPLPMTSNPPVRGDSGAPCTGGNCADFDVLGFWGNPSIATGTPSTITVTSRLLNSGPAATGDVKEVWEVDPPSGVTAAWGATITKATNGGGPAGAWSAPVAGPALTVSGTMASFHDAGVPKDQTNSYVGSLTLTCASAGDYIVAIKAYAYGENGDVDNNTMNNVAVSAVRIKCPADAGEIDVQSMGIASSIWTISGTSAGLNPAIDQVNRLPPGDHVQLLVGDSATLQYGAIIRNQSATNNIGAEASLTAAASDPDNDNDYELGLSWNAGGVTGVSGSEPADQTALPAISASCVSKGGQACAGLEIDLVEPAGKMISINADLTVTCTQAGTFVLPVKIANMATDFGDPEPINNTFFEPGVVYCWATADDRLAAIDGIDDTTGLYPSWSSSESSYANYDPRKPVSPTNRPATALPSDTGWADRYIASPSCYFYNLAGAPDGGDGWVTAAESRAVAPAGIDDDGDCLADAAVAQPGNAVDPNDAVTATMCPALVYNDGHAPMAQIQYSVNADEDCDGLIDGIDAAFGGNPRLADTDGDGLSDFYEMFQFTSPVNPDTDGDGYLDMPASTYQNASTSFDNCPGVYNPSQLNTDGKQRDNGPKIPGTFASNPAQDKAGDACDTDDDNDGLIDTAEAIAGTDPLNPNSDGTTIVSGAYDRCIDGVEVLTGTDPLSAASKCGAVTSSLVTYLDGCHLDLPGNADFQAYNGNLWVEDDPDGDGIACVSGTTIVDTDNDNGTGNLLAGATEVSDAQELQGYGTAIARKDTDGDGCADWIEIMDITGDRKVTVADQTNLAKRAALLPGFEADVISDAIYDVSKDGKISVQDQTLMAKNVCGLKPSEPGCPACLPES